jgi:hypothetical protein
VEGIKHIIGCHCMLPQYKNSPNPIFHKFVVFSIVDDSDTVIPKYSQCNNCGIIHKVVDLCRSEIITGKEELKSIASIDDIRLTLSDDICKLLDVYNVDMPTWEHVQFILEKKKWNSHVVLTKDAMEDETQGKMLQFDKEGKPKIATYIQHDVFEIPKIKKDERKN